MSLSISSFAQKISRKMGVSGPPRLYSGCADLTLSRFRRCVMGDLQALVREGVAAERDLKAAWDSIFLEYIDLIRQPEQMYMLTLMKEIALLESELNLSAGLVLFLSLGHSPEAEAGLKKMGYRLTLKPGDRKHNALQLDKVVRQRKSRLLALSQKQKLLEEHQRKLQTGPKENPGDFDRAMAELSAFQGYRLDPNQVTVSEYAAIHNRFKKHMEDSKKPKRWKK